MQLCTPSSWQPCCTGFVPEIQVHAILNQTFQHPGGCERYHPPRAHDPSAGTPRVWQEHPACCPSWQVTGKQPQGEYLNSFSPLSPFVSPSRNSPHPPPAGALGPQLSHQPSCPVTLATLKPSPKTLATLANPGPWPPRPGLDVSPQHCNA